MSDKNKETELKEDDIPQATAEEPTATEQETTDTEEALVEEHEQNPTAKLEEELAALKDKNLRLFAEFENHRKRTAKERLELFSTANQELMVSLLPVLDDFERALKNLNSDAAEGVQLIYNKFENTLKGKGLVAMEDTTGKDFDVESMEAITRIPAPDEKLKGKVVDQIEKGYLLGTKIIRYAKVVVGE
jgi:molecular chaperone GrpE